MDKLSDVNRNGVGAGGYADMSPVKEDTYTQYMYSQIEEQFLEHEKLIAALAQKLNPVLDNRPTPERMDTVGDSNAVKRREPITEQHHGLLALNNLIKQRNDELRALYSRIYL